MPRDLPLGNGSLLVAFDENYQIRDLFWPHVGQENHALGHPFRVGVWVDGHFSWLEEEGWQRELRYQPETLVTDVKLGHPKLQLTLKVADGVDFHENLLVRRFDITNLADHGRIVTLFFQHDFHIAGNEVGDTTYYEPERRAVFHYKGARWFLINGTVELESGDPGPGWEPTPDTAPGLVVGVHQWACGLKEIHNLQGTWRDAEDGQLSGNAAAHGSVDSTVGFSLHVPPGDSRTLYTWLAVADGFGGVAQINRLVRQRGPQAFLDRGAAFWRLWLNSQVPDLGDLPSEVKQQYQRSLLIVRTQIDNGGAIIAANDSDISSDVRDTYSYMWPRDGALVADALDMAGYLDLPREFFHFCDRVDTREGFLLHKYNPDGTLASSWHPWYRNGHKDLPIQEDETALVLWALWRHFERFGDVFFIKPLYRTLICPIGDFLASFRDLNSGLPSPSYDLWEERRGVLSWTVAATWGGLVAAADFAAAFGETDRAQRYRQVASEIKAGAESDLWQPQLNCFARMITWDESGAWQVDKTIDASQVGLWKFGMYAPDDPKIIATMQVIRDRLWVKSMVGGLARYENDRYHQVSADTANVPGNPWFICTLWLAEWYAVTAKTREDLQLSLDLLRWVANHALPSGVLAEQLHPYTGEPLSVSPLTWSHAEFITSVIAFLQAWRRLT
ncbi:MAG TPA: glycoside hydrolase family 15 protein [Anaerolineales bacterium]|nr:glycoside hydrolase family 15 protein [Anaerolineales bacterium]